MGEDVETAELHLEKRDGESSTDRASRPDETDATLLPHGQSQIYMEEVWVGSQTMSRKHECHGTNCCRTDTSEPQL